MNRLCRLFFSISLLGGSAQAGDRVRVSQVSFSPDNARVMALTEWVQDGSGFPQAALHVFDTAQGRPLLRVSSYSQNTALSPRQLTDRMLVNHAAKLRAAGLWERPQAQPKFLPKSAPPLQAWSEALRPGQNKTYPVFLWSRAVPVTLRVKAGSAKCAAQLGGVLPDGEKAASFSVDVNGQELALPASLPCAARYALGRVDLSGNRVLLTVQAYVPGFGGPDAWPIFLAATLK